MDESNATCGKRLESIGLENTVENRQAYRELLVTTPGLGQYISGECARSWAVELDRGRRWGADTLCIQVEASACPGRAC